LHVFADGRGFNAPCFIEKPIPQEPITVDCHKDGPTFPGLFDSPLQEEAVILYVAGFYPIEDKQAVAQPVAHWPKRLNGIIHLIVEVPLLFLLFV
jgi:hypothetical protein